MVYSGVGHAPPRNAASLVATGFIVMVEFAHFNRDEEEFPMTEDRLLIEELAAKGGQPDFLRTIAENVLQLIMEADVDGLIGGLLIISTRWSTKDHSIVSKRGITWLLIYASQALLNLLMRYPN
jgi:hypothetical protein